MVLELHENRFTGSNNKKQKILVIFGKSSNGSKIVKTYRNSIEILQIKQVATK